MPWRDLQRRLEGPTVWRGVDITTFPTPTLWEWVDGLKEEIKTIRAEIDRRAEEAAGPPVVVDKRTGRPFERTVDALVEDAEARRPTGGHPPGERKAKGKQSLRLR